MLSAIAHFATLATILVSSALPTFAASPPGVPSRFVIRFTSADCTNSTLSGNLGPGFKLQGLPLSQSRGLPAALNGTSTNSTLIFEDSNPGNSFGAFVSGPRQPGEKQDIQLAGSVAEFGWGAAKVGGQLVLTHEKQLANDQFFSCLVVVDNNIINVLTFGSPAANGTLPKFCFRTTPVIVGI